MSDLNLRPIREAVEAAVSAAVSQALSDVYNRIQLLGPPGLHSEASINRQAALDEIAAVRRARGSSRPFVGGPQ